MAVHYASKPFVLSFTEAVAEKLSGSGVSATASRWSRTNPWAWIGYQGMMDEKVIVIPGIINKLGVQSLRLGPRAIVRKAAKKLQES